MLLRTTSFAILYLLAQSKPNVLPIPKDFAIRAVYGDDIIDTFNCTYTRKGVPRKSLQGKPPLLIDSTVSFTFSSSEKTAIYNYLIRINYKTYPAIIKSNCTQIIEPGSDSKITVRNNNNVRVIRYYDDCVNITDNKALKFNRFINLLYKAARSHEEVKKLPESMNIDL